MPLGLCAVIETWLHAAALAGPEAHAVRLERLLAFPGAPVLAGASLAALAFHGSYGMVLALRPGLNVSKLSGLGHTRGWLYVAQRVSAVFLLAFLAAHLALFWWPLWSGSMAVEGAYHHLVARLSGTYAGVPAMAFGYALGIAAMAYHLAHGAFTIALRWGFVRTRQSRRRTAPAFALFGVSLFAAGFLPVMHLATGDRLIDRARVESELCAPLEPR